jgi:hypothetical protein
MGNIVMGVRSWYLFLPSPSTGKTIITADSLREMLREAETRQTAANHDGSPELRIREGQDGIQPGASVAFGIALSNSGCVQLLEFESGQE